MRQANIQISKFLIGITFCSGVFGQVANDVTRADANDYLDCAALHSSLLASLNVLNIVNEENAKDLKERTNLYLRSAMIYSGASSLTEEMKNRFLTSNSEYTATASKLIRGGDKEAYLKFIDSKLDTCKKMLNVNAKVLIEKQGIKLK